jgi:hypothetical protein
LPDFPRLARTGQRDRMRMKFRSRFQVADVPPASRQRWPTRCPSFEGPVATIVTERSKDMNMFHGIMVRADIPLEDHTVKDKNYGS